ncbi:MAG TPA: multidrug resistance efflux transporter family protein [Daejeonella sp.]|nr:multidrug resistance efflux transporter family protein [Daejeonella sp.]
MALSGDYWMWSASLRYLLTLPILMAMGLFNKKMPPLFKAMKNDPKPWIIWGSIGFGAFYLALTSAAKSSPAWLVAGTFQLTIIAGLLMGPFIYDDHRAKIPKKALLVSLFIFAGVLFSLAEQMTVENPWHVFFGFIMVTISAILFPLGNRMMMIKLEKEKQDLDAFQRVLGMTIGSIPLWILVSIVAYDQSGWPSTGQIIQSGGVALSSSVIATILFFKATAMVKNDATALGAVEATQSTEIIITLVAELLILHTSLPSWGSMLGILIISGGMFLYAKVSVN